jgi:ATP-dependent DNA helicase RecG
LRGERSNIKFKEYARGISSTVYETVCAFLNAQGGDILLGVKDNGNIIGIVKGHISSIKQDVVTSVNNLSKLLPTVCLSAEEFFIDGKKILHIIVSKSSQVQRCVTKIFIHNNCATLNITYEHQEVSNLYMRKQSSYSENKIFS